MVIDNEILEKFDAWWNNTNDEALIWRTSSKELFVPENYRKEWMPVDLLPNWAIPLAAEKFFETGDSQYMLDACAFLKAFLDTEHYEGVAVPRVFLNFGPGNLAACITNYAKFNDNTVWFELEDPMNWDDILSIDKNVRTKYADIYAESIKIVTNCLAEDAIITFPDLGAGFDILASLRKSQELLMDLIMYPDDIKKSLLLIHDMWNSYQNEYFELIENANNGLYTFWIPALSRERFYLDQCDFSAMISPDMFEEFVLPDLSKRMNMFKHALYHLDGAGEIPHVKHLATIENLHAIQWISGAGEAYEMDEKWYGLIEEILDYGKKVIIFGDESKGELPMKKLFNRFPKKEFYIIYL